VFLGLFGGAMASKEGGLADFSGLVSGAFKVGFYDFWWRIYGVLTHSDTRW